jgi:uncharacterized protein
MQFLHQVDEMHGYRFSPAAFKHPTGEVDLVLEFRSGAIWVIEVKRSSAPSVSKGFYTAATDLGAVRQLLVAPVAQPYPMKGGIEVMNPLMATHQIALQN